MRVIIAVLLVYVSSASVDCNLCASSPNVCCSCCVDGLLSPGACNSPLFISAGCLSPSSTATPIISLSATTTISPAPSPPPDGGVNSAMQWASGCSVSSWSVPSGVTNITVYLWGASGQTNSWTFVSFPGGSGAFVSGVATVSPGEVLSIQVGGIGSSESCGWGGNGEVYSGGGYSSISRVSNGAIVALAGGGGGASRGCVCSGDPGLAIPGDGCGMFSPWGINGGEHHQSGGGGGWQGGGVSPYCCYGGAGGTSCAPGLLNGTITDISGGFDFAPNSQSTWYIFGHGVNEGPGLVTITWTDFTATTFSSFTASTTPFPTPSFLPTPLVGDPIGHGFSLSLGCMLVNWKVPIGVTNITVHLWGASGLDAVPPATGGGGAFLSGIFDVTPGESLLLQVGGTGFSSSCGWGGSSAVYSGGGFSSVSRYSLINQQYEIIALAGGGGGASYGRQCSGEPGQAIPADGCGVFSPRGINAPKSFQSGGGGGWQGGGESTSSCQWGGAGGTSCAPGLRNRSIVSLPGTNGFPVVMQSSPYYVGHSDGGYGPLTDGLVFISYGLQSPSAPPTHSTTNAATQTGSPTLSISKVSFSSSVSYSQLPNSIGGVAVAPDQAGGTIRGLALWLLIALVALGSLLLGALIAFLICGRKKRPLTTSPAGPRMLGSPTDGGAYQSTPPPPETERNPIQAAKLASFPPQVYSADKDDERSLHTSGAV